MAHWRAQFAIQFGNATDRTTFDAQAKTWEPVSGIVDKPFAYVQETEALSAGVVRPVEAAHIRFSTQADAKDYYERVKAFLIDPTVLVIGDPLAVIADPASIKGKASLHLCTHDEATPVPCNTNNYEDTVV